MNIFDKLNGLHEFIYVIDNIYDELVKKLSKIDKETC